MEFTDTYLEKGMTGFHDYASAASRSVRNVGNRIGDGKREWEFAQKETTAPRYLFTNSSRDDSATALTEILFTN